SLLLKVTHRVSDFAEYTNLEMEVGAEAIPRAAGIPDYLSLTNRLARGDGETRLVRVAGGETPAVVDAGVVAVAAARGLGLGESGGPAQGRMDRRSFRDGDIDPRVELVAGADVAGAEAGGDRPFDRPDHPQ